jgi:hypothetical protein
MTATKTEIALFVKMLESPEDYETPEDLAKKMIEALDDKRAEKTRYVAVGQFGKDRAPWYSGIGPYPGRATAIKAAESHPGFSLATKVAVVPVTSKEGFEKLLGEVG